MLLKRRKGCPFQGRSGGHTWRASSPEAARHQEVAPAGDGFARFGGGGDLFGGHEVVAARIIAAPTSAFARTTERLARLECCLLPFDFLAALVFPLLARFLLVLYRVGDSDLQALKKNYDDLRPTLQGSGLNLCSRSGLG